jgi:hypothetical protein
MSGRVRAAFVGAGLVVLAAFAVVLLTSTQRAALPTPADLHMPIARGSLDRSLTIGKPGVTVRGRTPLDVQSSDGQFRGHWWWNQGWVYVSGKTLPGSRIHVHIDNGSLTISETPNAQGVAQVRRYGRNEITSDDIEVDIVRFGIGAILFATRTAGGPFPGRHVVDQLNARAWSERGLTITRDQVTSIPADHISCTTMPQQPDSEWNLGCRMRGEPPLISDRRGLFPSSPNSVVYASAISLTATPNDRTLLPADSLRVDW